METIGTTDIWSFLDDTDQARCASNEEIRRSPGHAVHSYFDLARKVAELQFRNPSHVLLFRGQSCDYKEFGQTSLKPRIFRPSTGETSPPDQATLNKRFNWLTEAEQKLSERYREDVGRLGNSLIRRHRIVRWSVLQHYEVCRTPLLDVTHSLRIAASFASLKQNVHETFIFILAVPQLSGAITVNIEAGVQMVRLTSVCPPSALRPHFQEGYLLGEYPDVDDFDQKGLYRAEEIDFGLRLVAKFKFDPAAFWRPPNFSRVERPALYVDPARDPIFELTDKIRQEVRPWSEPSR
jgi:hypothetical protein